MILLAVGGGGLATRRSVKVPLLNDLAPDGFFYGGHYIIEFTPDSLWYETSLTIAAMALKQGMKTEYHVFNHDPADALDSISALGVDARRLEKDGLLSIWDAYTETMEYESKGTATEDQDKGRRGGWGEPFDRKTDPSRPLNVEEGAKHWIKAGTEGFKDEEKGWLHLDDNTATFLQYNDEKTFVKFWRLGALPYGIRARECPHFLGFVKGLASDAFYTQFESVCDGVIDLKAQEEGGRIEQYIRIRMLRGKTFDSRWHRIQLSSNGEVAYAGVPSEESRRLAAIVYTDMVGYTALGQRNEAQSLLLVEQQRKLIRPILARNNGREVKTMGDAFLAEFASALQAVRAAHEIQKEIMERNDSLPPEQGIRLRIGIHLGDVVESGGDILGDAVNVASRIEPLAEDGGVCLTRQVYDHVKGKVDIQLLGLGPKSLKNVTDPVEVYKMVMPWEKERVEASLRLDSRRVAVLPFANISPDPADAYFADGLTEELISKLSLVRGLKVIARTSVMGYRNKEKKISEIGSELGVGTVVEGSVRKAGNKIRVTAQLIDVGNEEHLWASSYDKDIDDIFAVQSDVAEKIASSLSTVVLPAARERIELRPTGNPLAYENYLKGRHYLSQGSNDMYLKAAEHFFEAIRLDPQYAEPHAELARTYGFLGSVGFFNPKEAYDKTLREAEEALRLNDKLPSSYTAMGNAYLVGMNWGATVKCTDKALEISPDDAEARSLRAFALLFQGRVEESVAEFGRAEEIDPISNLVLGGLSVALLGRGDLTGAETAARRALDISPLDDNPTSTLAYIALSRGERAEATRLFERLGEVGGQSWSGYLGYGYARVGRKEDAYRVLENLLEKSESAYIAPTIPAMVYAGLGDKEKTFEWLYKALEVRDPQLGFLGSDYVWFDLRSDPRFEDILAKVRTST